MPRRPHPYRELAFLINDVGRMIRTYADQEARRLDMTRAQWAVLKRVEANEGLNQSELAEMLDLQPISVTRLVDRLCDSGLLERRADPADRRVKRLFLKQAAQPLLDQLDHLGNDLMHAILEGLPPEKTEATRLYLDAMKDNLRRLLQANADDRAEDKENSDKETSYA
jgi:MarR family transcriptional regulator for hemolysin